MTAAEQEARRLIELFLPRMYCYLCSGMLTNTYEYKVALMNAKQCAIKVCEEKIKTIVELSEGQNGYWLDVIQKQIDIKTAINNYEI